MAVPALRRDAGTLSLIFSCLGAIIGSGWLFGPLHAARLAGAASVLAWPLGGAAILLLAFVYAELATLMPRSGGVIHFPLVSHGVVVARIYSLINFLGYVIVGPIEAMAVLTYLNNLYPSLTHADGLLTGTGFVAATLLLALFTVLNFLALRWVLFINNMAMWWKLLVPLFTLLALPVFAWHPANLHLDTQHPAATASGLLQALAGAGVIFSFLGFRQAVELAGEAAQPQRTLPAAIIGSVLIGVLLYTGLQVAFLGAIDPGLVAREGWAHLTYPGAAGPFAGLAQALGAVWLAGVLYVDAFISPAGTGFVYQTTATRVIFAMSETGLLPAAAGRLNRAGVPWVAGLLCFVCGLLLLLPFPSWQKLVSGVSSIALLAYSIGPITLMALRRQLPDVPRPFRLPAASVLAPLAFAIGNAIIYFAGFRTVSVLIGFVLVASGLWFLRQRLQKMPLDGQALRSAVWMLPYLAGLWGLSACGSVTLGGSGWLTTPWDLVVLIGFSLGIFRLAVHAAVDTETIRSNLLK